MTDVLFLAGFLVLPLIGRIVWTLPAVQRMDLGGRIAATGAAGALITAIVMALLSLIGVSWSRTILVPILGAIAALGWWLSSRRPVDPPTRQPGNPTTRLTLLVIAVFAVLTCYGILTARESAGDLQFFWGPKGIHFFRDGGISVEFLADKANPNSDYPPLLPLLYAWSHLVAHQFSWWAALLTTALLLFGAAFFLRACTSSDEMALLFAATLSWAMATSFSAGGADPPLIFFEVIALGALTFIDDPRSRDVLAAIGLAGAAWTKIEGATFVIAVVVAMIVVERSVKRALLVAAPAIVLLLGWVAFLVYNGLLFGYGGAKMRIYPEALPSTLALTAKAAAYELFWLPWIVPVILIALGRARRAALLPVIVAALTIGTTIFFYIHLPEPGWWIANSAQRVLLTPLSALIIAAAAVGRASRAPLPAVPAGS